MASPPKTKTVFTDWDSNSSQVEVFDNADSISIESKYRSADGSVEVTVGVRIRPDDLDAFEAQIRRIRELRGI